MKTLLVCLLALTTGCSTLTPRQKAIGTAILVTSVAISLQHSSGKSEAGAFPVYCPECKAVK